MMGVRAGPVPVHGPGAPACHLVDGLPKKEMCHNHVISNYGASRGEAVAFVANTNI
jgi:hypothetical protein